jgi:hypothetical protein
MPSIVLIYQFGKRLLSQAWPIALTATFYNDISEDRSDYALPDERG